MANQITDNRTQLADANNITDGISGSWVGSTSPAQDTDIYIEGTASIAEQMTNGLRWVMWNAGTTIDLSSNVIYIWVNCGVVGLLLTKASGGFRIRFAGPSTTNYFEVYVGGSDSWPTAVSGGWVQFVVDVDVARAAAITNGWTGGTAPATTAIQHVGYAAQTTAMTKVADNCWVDAIWRLPVTSPGIIIEGRSGGTTPWSFADIFTQLGQSAGCFRPGPAGSWVCNTPIQIGINDTTTHEFSDTNQLLLWDAQEYIDNANFYGIAALGNAGGTTNVTLGTKTGTGDAATGAQGVTIQSPASSITGLRFYLDFDDPNLDSVGLYGCTFVNGTNQQIDSASVEVISSTYVSVDSANVNNSTFLRNKCIDCGVIDGLAFLVTDDISDIRFCEFDYGAGHAIQITSNTVNPQTSKGNKFTGYGAIGTTSAALYNTTGGSLTINVTDLGDTPTYRNGSGASTTINNAVTLNVTVQDEALTKLQNIRVAIYDSNDVQLMNELTDVNGLATESYAYTGDEQISIRVRKSSTGATRYIPVATTGTITSAGFSLTVTLQEDPNVI